MNCESRSRYASKSAIGRVATPLSIAALATATGTLTMSRGSNGFGIRYSGPNDSDSPAYACATMSDSSACASSAIARMHASFISSVIDVAPTSSAPRKMNGKHSTLLTWFG